jgi:hypothetical protein
MPPAPAGTEVSVRLWLDDQKELKAQFQATGFPASDYFYPSGARFGGDALLTEAYSQCIDAGAVLEANKGKAALRYMADLLGARAKLESALGSGDRNDVIAAQADGERAYGAVGAS